MRAPGAEVLSKGSRPRGWRGSRGHLVVSSLDLGVGLGSCVLGLGTDGNGGVREGFSSGGGKKGGRKRLEGGRWSGTVWNTEERGGGGVVGGAGCLLGKWPEPPQGWAFQRTLGVEGASTVGLGAPWEARRVAHGCLCVIMDAGHCVCCRSPLCVAGSSPKALPSPREVLPPCPPQPEGPEITNAPMLPSFLGRRSGPGVNLQRGPPPLRRGHSLGPAPVHPGSCRKAPDEGSSSY